MFCPECGQQLPQSAKFCLSCGAKSSDSGESSPTSKLERKHNAAGIFVAVIAISAIVGLFAFQSQQGSSDQPDGASERSAQSSSQFRLNDLDSGIHRFQLYSGKTGQAVPWEYEFSNGWFHLYNNGELMSFTESRGDFYDSPEANCYGAEVDFMGKSIYVLCVASRSFTKEVKVHSGLERYDFSAKKGEIFAGHISDETGWSMYTIENVPVH